MEALVRVLFLDKPENLSSNTLRILEEFTCKFGVEFLILYEKDLPFYVGPYEKPKKEFLAEMERRARDSNIIVVADNLGFGFPKAKVIPLEKRENTIITWDLSSSGDEVHYRKIKFQNFCAKGDLLDKILDILKIGETIPA
jgi:hypothetical protein